MICSFCTLKTNFRIIRISLPYISLSLMPSRIHAKVCIIMYKMRCILKFRKYKKVSGYESYCKIPTVITTKASAVITEIIGSFRSYNGCCGLTLLSEPQIRKFCIVVWQTTSKNCTKMHVAHAAQ